MSLKFKVKSPVYIAIVIFLRLEHDSIENFGGVSSRIKFPVIKPVNMKKRKQTPWSHMIVVEPLFITLIRKVTV